MRRGARDRVLMSGGKLQTSPYLFPASAGHGAGRHGKYRDAGQRWKPSGIRAWLQRTIVRLAPELGLDSDTMDELWGGATAHTFRALFNSYWERRDKDTPGHAPPCPGRCRLPALFGTARVERNSRST